MIYSKIVREYLNGTRFSNGEKFNLASDTNILYRDDYLLNIAKDKKIIHLGFVDHLPLIDNKIKKGIWLHEKLINVSEVCFGIDINKEGIKYIQEKYNYDKLYALDIIDDLIPDEIIKTKIDYLLIPDVIEHIGNPVSFLSAVREKFKNNIDKIIITTPNALRLNNFKNAFKNIELINTDHRFWFTPYTISKIATDAGYVINELGFYEHGKLSKKHIIKKIFINKYYTFKDTLILDMSLK